MLVGICFLVGLVSSHNGGWNTAMLLDILSGTDLANIRSNLFSVEACPCFELHCTWTRS